MDRIVIGFVSGRELVMECERFTANINKLSGELTKIEWEGCRKCEPMYIDLSQVESIHIAEREVDA